MFHVCCPCIHVCACRGQTKHQVPFSVTPLFYPVRQSLSLNPELQFVQLNWQPTSPNYPPVSAPNSTGVADTVRSCPACYIGARIRTHVLVVVQQALLTTDPSLQFPISPLFKPQNSCQYPEDGTGVTVVINMLGHKYKYVCVFP